MAGLRRLGVYGVNLPTKKERAVLQADFSIAGLYGKFERKYDVPFSVSDTNEALAIFGPQIDAGAYGWDAVNGFFANLSGARGKLYIAAYKGTGAVQASYTLADQQTSPLDTLTLKAAYQTYDEYGVGANRTGFTLTGGAVFSSAVTTLPTGTGATARVITLASVVGCKVGDIFKLSKTGYAEYHFITAVDESAKTVTWTDADYAGTGAAEDYTGAVMGFQIKTYRKDVKGVVSEVDTTLGKKWMTFNSNDPDKYVETVLEASSRLKGVKLTPGTDPTAAEALPADVTTVTYLAGGTDGTQPASVSDWNTVYALLDNKPVRMVANVETSNASYQSALESYCNNREDNPIAFLVGQYDLSTKALVIAAGQGFQRSDEVDGVFVHNWIGISDPFSSSASAPKRAIPAAGHLMGEWIASIATYGIHSSPARRVLSIKGASEVYGYQALDDDDRTDLADAGVNVLQLISGRGIVLRNLFTSSTAPEFRNATAVIQRNFYKVSIVDSLQESENTPNDIGHVREDRMAVIQFMHRQWKYGSTGSVKEGETFGQYENEDGTTSTEDDAYEVIADASNNSVVTLQAGERNIDMWFMSPTPAGSIRVGVGLLYKTA